VIINEENIPEVLGLFSPSVFFSHILLLKVFLKSNHIIILDTMQDVTKPSAPVRQVRALQPNCMCVFMQALFNLSWSISSYCQLPATVVETIA